MKIMILTAATGGGHMRAASAIDEYIRNNTEHEAVTVDALKSVGWLLDKTVCDSYLFMARKAPSLFGMLYKSTNKQNAFSGLVPKLSSAFSHMLLETINRHQPDAIISTHPFAAEMVSSLKDLGDVSVPLICLITDYGLHRAWVAPDVDGYVVASENMVDELVSIGVEKSKIHPFGIPVHGVFFRQSDKNQILEEMGFGPSVPTILLMAGSFGVTHIIKLYQDLIGTGVPMQLIIITGNNQKLYDAFEKELAEEKTDIPTKLLFFTKEVDKYMHAADLLITKPGGLTVSEALACNLPMAVFDAIPGQEEDNAKFLSMHDMGIQIGKNANFAEIISELITGKEKLKTMRENCAGFDTSNSVHSMLELLESLSTEYESMKTAIGVPERSV